MSCFAMCVCCFACVRLEGTLGTGADLHLNGCPPMMDVAKGMHHHLAIGMIFVK